MTLTVVPRLIVSVVMLLVFAGWMLSMLKQFALSVITRALTTGLVVHPYFRAQIDI
ncbi:MAG: flagellar biosynthetic protein FliQ [Paucimonas sp.]|jgi:flagellar biosynthetic protein FliQ|nr:flagellar biosynthetic protein FliQ [Paucimonas sp.]